MFTGEKIIEWSPLSPYLNPIENLWSIVKLKLPEYGKQYDSKSGPWGAIKTAMSEVEPGELKKTPQKTPSQFWDSLAHVCVSVCLNLLLLLILHFLMCSSTSVE